MTVSVWRVALGAVVLGTLLLILAALGPIYLDDYRLKSYVKGLASSAVIVSMPDEAVRSTIARKANQLDLPVRNGDVTVTHPAGRVAVDVKYVVAVNFPLYNVDLHFHTSASNR